VENSCACGGHNRWHHPYTYHSVWCPRYEDEETEEAKARNDAFDKSGGYYRLGWPVDAPAIGMNNREIKR
jgi:hypothetical protein